MRRRWDSQHPSVMMYISSCVFIRRLSCIWAPFLCLLQVAAMMAADVARGQLAEPFVIGVRRLSPVFECPCGISCDFITPWGGC